MKDYLLQTIEVLEIPHIFVNSDEFVYLKLCHIYLEIWRPLHTLSFINVLLIPSDAEGTL